MLAAGIDMVRIGVLVVCWLWLGPAQVAAECLSAPALGLYQGETPGAPAIAAAGDTSRDVLGRIVAPVLINNQGPFRFIVDTGANRSVVSQALADRLGLSANGTGEVHSVHGVTVAPLVPVQSVRYNNLPLGSEPMPVLQSAVLAGEQGLLGVDGMTGRRLKLDFDRHCIEIIPSRGAPRLAGWEVIRGELRFGSLLVIRGSVNGLRINLMLDTGSDTSLANEALRTALNARIRRDRARLDFAVSMNENTPVVLNNAIELPSLRIGSGTLEVRDVLAYVGDFHIFQLWDLIDEPALLLGMDVLSQTRGIAIDYERRTVAIHTRDPPPVGTRLEDFQRTFGAQPH